MRIRSVIFEDFYFFHVALKRFIFFNCRPFFPPVARSRHLSNFELPSLHLLNRFLIYVILCHRRQCCSPPPGSCSSSSQISSRAAMNSFSYETKSFNYTRWKCPTSHHDTQTLSFSLMIFFFQFPLSLWCCELISAINSPNEIASIICRRSICRLSEPHHPHNSRRDLAGAIEVRFFRKK